MVTTVVAGRGAWPGRGFDLDDPGLPEAMKAGVVGEPCVEIYEEAGA